MQKFTTMIPPLNLQSKLYHCVDRVNDALDSIVNFGMESMDIRHCILRINSSYSYVAI